MTEFIQCCISISNLLQTKYGRMNLKTTTVVEIIILSNGIADYNLEERNAHVSDKNQNLIRQNKTRYAVMAEQPHHCHPRS